MKLKDYTVHSVVHQSRRMFKTLFLIAVSLVLGISGVLAQGTEDFEAQEVLSASYATNSFTNATTGIKWSYANSRNEGDYAITTKGIMLRYANSYLEATLPNGFGQLSFQYRKAFTGGSERQLELLVNGTQVAVSPKFGTTTLEETTVYDFSYAVNTAGPVTIKIKNVGEGTTNKQTVVDNIVWTAYVGGGTPTASAPTFSPATGSYFSPQNVTLTSATAGATIYYTLDGQDPTETSTVYSDPIPVSATTTIKAISYADGHDPSFVSSATYTFPTVTDVANIAALRAVTLPSTELYRLTGEAVLAFKTAARNAKYIQDATGGVLIDDASAKITTAYNVGDGITGIIGTLTVYNGMLQFVPVTDPGAATSTANVITPIETTLDNMAAYQGQLVKVKNVTIAETGVFAASTNYTLSDGTNVGVMRTQYYDLPYLGADIPVGLQDITGVVLVHTTTAQLVPRSIDDFTPATVAAPTLTITELSVPAMTAEVGATDTETITVNGYNLTGDISLAVSGTDAALFTVSTPSITPVSGAVTAQTLVVTYTPTAAGSHEATLTLTSAGADPVSRSLTGTATWAPLDAPVAQAATGILATSFNANWGAVDGATEYIVDVYTKSGASSTAADLFFSEYVEGSSNNKVIEIFNGTGATVDLSAYKVVLFSNGATIENPGNTTQLEGTLANNATYIVYNSGSAAAITSIGNIASTVTYFNGDDAFALYKGETLIDVFGTIGEDPGSAWTADGGYTTVDKTLRRKSSVAQGQTANLAGFPTLATEWDLYEKDDFSGLGSHTFSGGSASVTPVTGSPFTVTGATTLEVTGLQAGVNYFYTVKAKNANVTSEASNEVSVVTSFSTGVDNNTNSGIFTSEGYVLFDASAGDRVEVYNVMGQKLISTLATDGLNRVMVDANGIVIVKVGNRTAKLIL